MGPDGLAYTVLVTRSAGSFELRGSEADEARLVVHPCGYAIVVPGHPHAITPSSDSPRYDLLLAMTDVPIEVGIRRDSVPTDIAPAALVASMISAYVTSRAADAAAARPGHLGFQLANGAAAGMSVNYRIAGEDNSALELLAVSAKPGPSAVDLVFLTARYRTGEVTPFAWSSVRAAMLGHQSWTPGELPSTEVWPTTGAITIPGAKFELTEAATREARAKADELRDVPADVVDRIADLLLSATNGDETPTIPWHPFASEMFARRMAMSIPSRFAEVLLRDIGDVQHMHDFRGWCWANYWAVGNRAELRTKTS